MHPNHTSSAQSIEDPYPAQPLTTVPAKQSL